MESWGGHVGGEPEVARVEFLTDGGETLIKQTVVSSGNISEQVLASGGRPELVMAQWLGLVFTF